MRYGRILDRRVAKLETVFVVPSPQDEIAALQAGALTMMSIEDLKSLREIFVLQSSGCTIEEMPEPRLRFLVCVMKLPDLIILIWILTLGIY